MRLLALLSLSLMIGCSVPPHVAGEALREAPEQPGETLEAASGASENSSCVIAGGWREISSPVLGQRCFKLKEGFTDFYRIAAVCFPDGSDFQVACN